MGRQSDLRRHARRACLTSEPVTGFPQQRSPRLNQLDSTTTIRHQPHRQARPRNGSRPAATRTRASSHARLDLPFEPAQYDPTPVEFASLGFDRRLLQGVADRSFERTTPVQSAVFPLVLEGGDVIACAQTGTGKTLAFLLPIMQRMLAAPDTRDIDLEPADTTAPPEHTASPQRTRVLILAPTRELAVQIEDDFQGFAYHTSLSGVAVYGGVGADAQAHALRNGVDIVVATPGRLLDLIQFTLGDLALLAQEASVGLAQRDFAGCSRKSCPGGGDVANLGIPPCLIFLFPP